MSFQQTILVGNLGRDPEMRFLPSGQPVTNLSVATSRSWTNNQGEKQEETTWFRVAVFGKSAETCNQYLKKGSKVLVEGRMQPARAFQKQDGSWGASLEVTAQNVRFLSSGAGGGQHEEPAAQAETEDIPF
jgi:single-strand DNA-binding protein